MRSENQFHAPPTASETVHPFDVSMRAHRFNPTRATSHTDVCTPRCRLLLAATQLRSFSMRDSPRTLGSHYAPTAYALLQTARATPTCRSASHADAHAHSTTPRARARDHSHARALVALSLFHEDVARTQNSIHTHSPGATPFTPPSLINLPLRAR